MRRFGRKPVFCCAAAAVIGSAPAAWSIVHANFWIFCIAIMLHGVFQATSNFYTFAASESAGPEDKSVAISWVLTGGVIAAIVGTNTVSFTADNWAPDAARVLLRHFCDLWRREHVYCCDNSATPAEKGRDRRSTTVMG